MPKQRSSMSESPIKANMNADAHQRIDIPHEKCFGGDRMGNDYMHFAKMEQEKNSKAMRELGMHERSATGGQGK